ncbi:MAG TPA: LytTR family DNA-binding domain-containing protein [Pyrinomonadaceae bacterium]|nr:LytTR family DNA-binding domain-containing protein [Pyrinomonadaceae bacterium]
MRANLSVVPTTTSDQDEQIKRPRARKKLDTVVEEIKRGPKHIHWVMIKKPNKFLLLDVAGIVCIESQGNYVRVHHEGGSHLLRETISSLEEQLNPREFLRIHRSTIVQIGWIKELQRWFNGNYLVTMKNGMQLTLTRNYRANFRKAVYSSL